MRVRAAPDGLVGEVDRVFGVVDGHNAAAVIDDAGVERRLSLAALCAHE